LATAAVLLTLAGCSSEPAPPDDGGESGGGSGEVVQVPGALVNSNSAGISPDGARIAVPCDGSICVWDTAGGSLVDTWDGGSIVAWSPTGDVVATDRRDGPTVSLVLLEASSGDELATAEAFETEVVQDDSDGGLVDLAFSPDGETVAGVGSDGVLRLWSVADPADPAVIEVGQAIDVAFSSDSSRVAVAAVDGPVTIHDAGTGEELGSLDADPQRTVAWTADGASLATTSLDVAGAATTIWDAEELTVETTLPRAGDELAFAPTSDRLALTELEESTVLVWDWVADEVTELSGAEDDPRAVLWAPDGTAVYAVSARDGVLAWAPDGGEPTRFDAPVSG